MKKTLFFILACAILIGCTEEPTVSLQRDLFTKTEVFDTLTCETPSICIEQKEYNGQICNRMDIQIDNWQFYSGDSIVELPSYVFYFPLSLENGYGFIPSGIYSTSAKQGQQGKINFACRNAYIEVLIGHEEDIIKTEMVKRCCIEITHQEGDIYDLQVWMEMYTEPYFRYSHIQKAVHWDDLILFHETCNWWQKYF